MKKALVLGGTGFFGIDLVNHLLDSGWDVTVATRGKTEARFHGTPTHIKTDRHSADSLKRLAENGTWDVLFDQRCFSSYDAHIALEALGSKVGKIVLTSSTAVYAPGSDIRENAFDPLSRKFEIGPRKSYDEGKRDAEAVYTQQSPVPVAMGRLAVVLGFPDPTNRIEQHVRAINAGTPIYLPNPDARTSLISREDAGRFIASLGVLDVTSPVNGAPQKPIRLRDFYGIIAEELGKELKFSDTPTGAFAQKYGREVDTFLNGDHAKSLEIPIRDVPQFLPVIVQEAKSKLIDRIIQREQTREQAMQP